MVKSGVRWTILLYLLLNCSCSNKVGEVYRSVGFKVVANHAVQISERLRFESNTIYLTPDGERTTVQLERLGFFIQEKERRTELPFLNSQHKHTFFPLGKSQFWVALISMDQPDFSLNYSPSLGDLEEVLIFSPEGGVVFRFELNSHDILFPRASGVLWVRKHGESNVFSLSSANGELNFRASPENTILFRSAISSTIDLKKSLGFFDLNDLSLITKDLESIPTYSDAVNELRITSDFPKDGDIVKRFFFGPKNSDLACVFQTKEYITLDSLIVVNNGRIWYYEVEIFNKIWMSKLQSVSLGECEDYLK